MKLNHQDKHFRRLLCLGLPSMALGLLHTEKPALAQTAAADATAAAPRAVKPYESGQIAISNEFRINIVGKTLDGAALDTQALRGKALLVMMWSSANAMCRDRMPELRENYVGWKGKPFEIVAVSHDRKLSDLMQYKQIIASFGKPQQNFPWLWAGDPAYKDNLGMPKMLPTSYLIDKKGMVVESYAGRIPADVWDKIADMVY